jgi:hypothetical protein
VSIESIRARGARTQEWLTPGKRGKGNKARTADAPEDTTPAERKAAMSWAQRLKRASNIDIETRNSCGGPVKFSRSRHPASRDISASMHVIACIEDPVVIEKILTHLDRKAICGAARRLPPCRAPPQANLFG